MALRQLGDETVTVSTTAIGFTAAEINPTKPGIVTAKVYVDTGGPIRINSSSTPTADGTEGSPLVYAGGDVTVSGPDDIKNFKMIKATGGSDATVRVQFFGTGS